MPADALPSELGGNLKVDHGAWLRNCYKSMTNRAGDLCDISTGSNPISFPRSSEEAGSVSEADDRPDEEEISEAGPSEEEEEEDDDVEEIEEPVAIQVESVAHRLVRDCKAESYPFPAFIDGLVSNQYLWFD